MGFYGHISNIQKTSMTFDRIYSNRTAMDKAVAGDGVYAGRYVLVEYNSPLDITLLAGVVSFDGMLYSPPPQKTDWVADNPDTYLVKLVPLKTGPDLSENIMNGHIKSGIIAVCSSDFNLGIVQNEAGEKHIATAAQTQFFKILDSDTTKMSYNLLYNYKDQRFELDVGSTKETKTGCSYIEVSYSSITTDTDSADANYSINFNIDLETYKTPRGYDSTVWQKTYADGRPKYVMIAELNSVVPVIDVTADAPTLAPVMPHFDQDSSNIYYKLHMQPSWGFRIKGANPAMTVPALDYSGSTLRGTGSGNIHASSNVLEYPSDQKVQWVNTIYAADNDTSDYKTQYLKEVSQGTGKWSDDESQEINGAIYFNRAGFDKDYIGHSSFYPYTKRDLTLNPLRDEISLSPTGYSGHMYPTHTSNGQNIVQPDVNELSILLPSIGDTISEVWDVIYGGVSVSKQEGEKKYRRNTIIRWEDAKKIHAKEGLRLVRNLDSSVGYSYNKNEVNTIAGVINSVQDIMGMIITEYDASTSIDTLNEDYIYYNNGKYYYKKPTYTYEAVSGEVSYEKVDLEGWNSQYWWVDTNYDYPDYMKEEVFRPERKYVKGVQVPKSSDEAKSKSFTATDYEPGKYYIFQEWENPAEKTPFLDPHTKAPYNRYVKSNDKTQKPGTTYYNLTLTPHKLAPNTVFYIPNKYYAGYFEELPRRITTEKEFETYLKDGIRLFYPLREGASEYGFLEAVELKSGEFNSGKVPSDGWRKVKGLTLRTCALSSSEYATLKNQGNAPMLFSYEGDKKDSAQNYYVMEEKYEYINVKDKTWEQAVSQAPGVYYYLDLKAEDLTKAEVLNADNTLKSGYVSLLKKEEDIILEDDNIYFRKVVTLKLSSTDETSIADVQKAQLIDPQPFPDNLYMYFSETISNVKVEGYKSVSILSHEIVTSQDYSTLSLYTLERQVLGIGYESNKYYYEETTGPYAGSVILDNQLNPTPGRKYWDPAVINKRQLTTAEVNAGRKPGITYYRYNTTSKTYVEYLLELRAGTKYYVSSLSDAPEIYYPNKYYYQDSKTGGFILATGEFDSNIDYYRNPQLYILEDTNGFYEKGALWPLAQNPPANSGITLAKRKEAWELAELTGFDVNFNTLHGLLLRLNQWMMQNDTLTRDEATLQGALNKLNDLINRFGNMKPGQLMMVDNTGRINGVSYTTKQDFSAVNHGGGSVTIESTEADANGEDRWIDLDSVDDYKNPRIILKHNFTKVKDTISVTNTNTTKADTIGLYTPIVDAKGHVVGKNVETVTLPFGFKTLTATNSNTETLSQETVGANDSVVAETTQDTLALKAKNKWIEFTTNASDDSITIAHRARNEMTDSTNATVVMDDATGNNRDILGKVLADVGYDPAGHLISRTYTNFKLPNSYQSFSDEEAHMSTARNAHDTFTIKGDTWLKPTIAQNSVTYTHKAEEAVTSTLSTVVMDDSEDKNVFGPIVSDFDWDEAGHITTKKFISYKLPNSYQTFAVSADEKTVATNAYDTLTIAGDDWMKPVIEQGTLKYTHINQKISEGFTALGAHALGAQTPQFGETFNTQVYTLDANGHIVGKSTETVQIPTDIKGLLLTSYNAENNKYLTANITLEAALAALDSAIAGVQQTVDNNQNAYETASENLRNELDDYYTSMEEEHELIRSEMVEANEAILDALDDVHAEINETLKEKNESDAITYAPIEGNINEETSFVYQEAADDLPEVRLTVAEAITKLSELDSEVIKSNQKFVYTPAVEEVSHEATQEEVDAGLATTLGEKIIDVEAVPAEELTIAELFTKVKLIEQQLNGLI